MAPPPDLPRPDLGSKEDLEVRKDGLVFGKIGFEESSKKQMDVALTVISHDVTQEKMAEDAAMKVVSQEEMTQVKRQNGTVPKAALWADVAQEKKALKKYNFDILDTGGQLNVEIPDEVVVNANPLWEDFLIGKFLDSAPHIARIHAVVNKIWREGGKGQLVEVHEVDATTMKFKVPDPAMRARILRRGMWNIGNIPLVVTKWIPDELMEKPEVKSIPLWVHLKNVPLHMFSWEGLSFITSAAGHPVRLHPETAACKDFKLAKIFVNADLSKELPTKINFTKNGKSSLVEFIYPWLPLRCNSCGKWGHAEKACIMNKNDRTSKSVREIIEEGMSGKLRATPKENTEKEKNNEKQAEEIIKVVEAADTEGAIETAETAKEEVAAGNGEAIETVSESTESENLEVEIEEGEVIKEWHHVSPGKFNRSSQKMLLEDDHEITTPSRFSALEGVDDNGDLVNKKETEGSAEGMEGMVGKGSKQEEDVNIISAREVEPEGENLGKKNNAGENEQGKKSATEKKEVSDHTVAMGGSSMRPSLPRNSKTFHKIIPEPSGKNTSYPGTQGKRNSRKPSQ